MSKHEWILVRLMFSVLAVGGIVIYGLTKGDTLEPLPFAALAVAAFFAGRCLGISLAELANHYDGNNAD